MVGADCRRSTARHQSIRTRRTQHPRAGPREYHPIPHDNVSSGVRSSGSRSSSLGDRVLSGAGCVPPVDGGKACSCYRLVAKDRVWLGLEDLNPNSKLLTSIRHLGEIPAELEKERKGTINRPKYAIFARFRPFANFDIFSL
jgi:hypothetical protein